VVNQLDDSARETFPTGRPLEDTPELQVCKICKKSVLKTAIAAHVEECVKAKNEKLRKKKEQKEAREREKKLAAKGDEKEKEKDEEGDTRMEEDDEDEDVAADKKAPGGLKSAKKSAGKKIEVDDNKKGKKRKADGDAEKGPKQKKKKEEPKPKAPKQKGILNFHYIIFSAFFARLCTPSYCRFSLVRELCNLVWFSGIGLSLIWNLYIICSQISLVGRSLHFNVKAHELLINISLLSGLPLFVPP
jgi:hypothetical protein